MVWLSNIVHKLQLLKGMGRYGAAFLAGMFLALSQAPYYFLPALFISFPVLVWLLQTLRRDLSYRRISYFLGWSFGFGYFVVGLYWLAYAFFVQANQFALLSPLAVLGMPAFLGLFTGCATLAAVFVWRHCREDLFILALSLAVFWAMIEFIRGHVLTGFPWNLTSQALVGYPILRQGLSLVGPYGLGLVFLIAACMGALFISFSAQKIRSHRTILMAMGGSFASLIGFGVLNVTVFDQKRDTGIYLQVVQPNVSQIDKINAPWATNFYAQMAQTGGEAFASIGPSDKVYVIWPENAVPFLDESQDALDVIAQALPRNVILLAGLLRKSNVTISEEVGYYNSLAVFADVSALDSSKFDSSVIGASSKRAAVQYYDKAHLVPFGEYMPYAGLMKSLGISKIVPFEEGFRRGDGPQTLSLGDSKVSPLICYEIIFPGKSYPKKERPDWLLTITNDAWFGDSPGPRQHLAMAQMRAVETGLPVIRSANTGISAVIDAKGRVLDKIPLNTAGAIMAQLPNAESETLYMQIKESGFLSIVLFSFMVLYQFRIKRKATQK